MATQGLVSVRENDEVVMKIVAGADGYNASKVAAELKERWPVRPHDAYEIAVRNVFGSVHDLVVLTLGGAVFKGEEELNPRYQQTFADANFNPRWEHGTADHIEIVDIN